MHACDRDSGESLSRPITVGGPRVPAPLSFAAEVRSPRGCPSLGR